MYRDERQPPLDADVHRLRRELAEARATLSRLSQEAHEFRHLVDSVIDYAIFSMDPEGHILNWNPGATRMKGWRRDEVLGQHFRMLYVESDRARGRPEHNLETALQLGHFEEEGWRLRKDGGHFWAHVSITPVRDDDGRLMGFSKVTRDLTEVRRAEHVAQEASQARREIEMLREVDGLKNQFLSILSHELRTPINAIMGFGSVLDDGVLGPLTDQQHDYLRKMLGGAEVLLALINDLLDISRIAAGKFSLDPQPMSARAVISHVIEHLTPLAEQKRQRVEARVPEEVPPLVADPQRINQVLTNIVSNAIKFSPPATAILVGARIEPDGLVIEVVDEGDGIAEEDQPLLFQRFVQLDKGNIRQASGTGLGLSISKALVEAHGGTIGVRSARGEGSTFWFRLPWVAKPQP